jgi:hypothetical protein
MTSDEQSLLAYLYARGGFGKSNRDAPRFV